MSQARWLPAAIEVLLRLPAGSESDQHVDAGPPRRRHPALVPPEPPARKRPDDFPVDGWDRHPPTGAARIAVGISRVTAMLTTSASACVPLPLLHAGA